MRSEYVDMWAGWLLGPRYSADEKQRQALDEFRIPQAEKILKKANICPGDVVLDGGSGDGLLGFKAAPLTGADGKVVFVDVSPGLLAYCRNRAEQEYATRYEFTEASLDDLKPVPDGSLDVVVSRAAINFAKDKSGVFREFYRVLRPGGRISLWQGINRTFHPRPSNIFLDYDVEPIAHLTSKVYQAMFFSPDRRADVGRISDFDESDLLKYVGAAGFGERHMEFTVDVAPGAWLTSWNAFLSWAPNPHVPTFGEVIRSELTQDEAQCLTEYLRPKVEKQDGTIRRAGAFIWAKKV
jgi:arsenite methyltransferase